MSLDTIFAQAIEIASAQERAAFLDEACRNAPELRREVEQLVRDHFRAGAFLEQPAAHLVATALEPDCEQPGTVIGPYQLLAQIGEGGMGLVFVAEQQQPVRRRVALKVIKPGMDSRQVIARFEAERQALALMDHPNIAKVLDGGTTASGRPYFVMELVKGVAITQFCDANRLTTRQRLELFVSVCQAVQHAHQKGIIHRDLKPSNVLVTSHDGPPHPTLFPRGGEGRVRGVVKVIDFGVAKAVGQRLTEKTIFTQFTQILGTPLYMSPEQAGPSGLDIDTRTDIYALGVLLYELLTGTTPVDQERLWTVAYDDIWRIIREEEPAKPSTRISTLGPAAATVSANRQSDPRGLSRLCRGDLDWIVMKALEKDRNRRYESASTFAADVQRYLHDEPVQACPPSAGYRLRKFVRRNRGPVLAASLVVLSLVSGIVGTTVGLVRAERARQAQAERAEGEQQAKDTAQKRLAQIEKGIDILSAIFENLDPRAEEKGGRPLRALLGDRLSQAADQLEGEAVGDPVVVAGLQNRLGRSLLHLGLAEPALGLFLKARQTHTSTLGGDHPDTLASMNNLALAYKAAGKLDQALRLHEETLTLRKAKLGLDHPDTLTSMNNLAAVYRDAGKLDLALPLHEETLTFRKAKLGPDHPDTLISMNNLAFGYQVAGKLNLALPLYEETLKLRKAKLGPDHRSTLTSMNNLAMGYHVAGKLDLALPLLEETLKLTKAKLGDDHPDTLTGMNNLAMGYRAAGKLDLALPLLEETLKLKKAKLGSDHPETLISMNNLAGGLQAAGKLDQALRLYEETLTLRKAKLGPDHPSTLTTMNSLALGLRAAGKLDQALPLFEEAANGIDQRGYRHQNAGGIVHDLIGCQEQLKQFDRAEGWRRKWLAVVKAQDGPASAAYADALTGLGSNLIHQKKHADAETVLRESLAILQKIQPTSRTTCYTQSLLGAALLGQQKYADAEPLLVQGYQEMNKSEEELGKRHLGLPTKARLTEALERLVQLYDAWGMKDKADAWRQKWEEAKSP